jgi:hypothetical protein
MSNDLRDELANSLDEALLRASDGGVQLDRDTLRQAAEELLWGEHMWSGKFQSAVHRDTFVISRAERSVPAQNRRPAPSADEVWAAAPERLHELAARHRSSEDPDDRKWLLVPQPTYSPDTPFDELPVRIIRQCCESKTCGGTDLVKERREYIEYGVPAVSYAYVRASNDEGHPGFGAHTVEELVAQLNNPGWWPNQWSPHAFETHAGETGFDFNAPESAA